METPELQAAMSAAVVQTRNTQGWAVIVKVAENIVAEFAARALDCDDDAKAPGLLRTAKAAREFYNTFVNRVDQLTYLVVPEDPNTQKEFDSEETF
jgi:hypothetical protein